jgi:hypothetical protein
MRNDRESEPPASPVAIAVAVAIAVTIPLILWMVLSRTASSRTIDRLYGEIARRDLEIHALRTTAMAFRIAMEQPQIATPFELDAANNVIIEVPLTARSFMVSVHPAARSFRLRDAAGKVVWRGDVPRESTVLVFPREVMPAGDYVLHAGTIDYRFTLKYAG